MQTGSDIEASMFSVFLLLSVNSYLLSEFWKVERLAVCVQISRGLLSALLSDLTSLCSHSPDRVCNGCSRRCMVIQISSRLSMQGGLGLPLDQFTIAVTIGAVALIGFSLWALPRTTKRFGSLTLMKASSYKYMLPEIIVLVLSTKPSIFYHANSIRTELDKELRKCRACSVALQRSDRGHAYIALGRYSAFSSATDGCGVL